MQLKAFSARGTVVVISAYPLQPAYSWKEWAFGSYPGPTALTKTYSSPFPLGPHQYSGLAQARAQWADCPEAALWEARYRPAARRVANDCRQARRIASRWDWGAPADRVLRRYSCANARALAEGGLETCLADCAPLAYLDCTALAQLDQVPYPRWVAWTSLVDLPVALWTACGVAVDPLLSPAASAPSNALFLPRIAL